MKTSFFSVLVLILSGAAVRISADTPDQQGAEEEVRRLSDEEVKAFLRNDPEAMARL